LFTAPVRSARFLLSSVCFSSTLAAAGGAKYGLEPCADREGHGSKHERYAAGSEQPPFIDLTDDLFLDVAIHIRSLYSDLA
jgi:hypothetical protein